jgi:hypothetical protein
MRTNVTLIASALFLALTFGIAHAADNNVPSTTGAAVGTPGSENKGNPIPVPDQASLAGQALPRYSTDQGFLIQVHEMNFPIRAEECQQIQIVAVSRAEDARSGVQRVLGETDRNGEIGHDRIGINLAGITDGGAELSERIVTVKPLGEMPAIQTIGQVCISHLFIHLGEIALLRGTMGKQGLPM